MLVLACAAGRAEQEGEYGEETRNAPRVELTPARIGGLKLWLRSDAGVQTDQTGAVTAWSDDSGHAGPLPAAGQKGSARLAPGAVAGKPAVSLAGGKQIARGFQSNAIEIAPARGMTLFVLARLNGPGSCPLISYGPTYKTPGSLGLWTQGSSGGGRALLYAGTGAQTPPLGSSGGDVAGRGFMLFAARFDPAASTITIYQNGVPVGTARREEPLAERNALMVGAGGPSAAPCDLLSALAYNAALSDAEMRAVQRFLEAEYRLGGRPVSNLAPLLPFAYYPSRNQMEVAIELGPELVAKAGGTIPGSVGVRVVNAASGQEAAAGSVPLDSQGRGQSVFDVPDLPDGDYGVEYRIGKHVERSGKTFTRTHFAFEKTTFGATHEVFAPFTPVKVEGRTVSVVGRRYTLGPLGLPESIVSLDRELLAAPITLNAETSAGRAVWEQGTVEGRAAYPDEAVFECRARSDAADLSSTVIVQEDGCAKVQWTLSPAKKPATIERLWLDVPVRDSEAPLFHYIADNGMRFNYAGKTPRGGTIEWYREPWDGWVPLRWRVARPGPDSGTIWTSGDPRQFNNQFGWDHRPFCPYIWLGAEERGLALFMESERGFETDYRTPLQRVIREGDRIIIRVEIFQQPVMLDAPRTFTFGLMASPGKPMEKEFRTRPFASGIGPVSCWGGWQCASKYPTGHDWSIVDRIQEIRRHGKFTEADRAWFTAKYEEVKREWPDRKINGSTDWLWLTVHFAKCAERGPTDSGVYFEEHATDPRTPEFQVFQDEWASAEFNRFQDRPANWGVFSPSYHDFALYMANEWMSRGVSLYFDNTNPKRCYNDRFGPAYRSPDGALRYGISLFGQREYYRRIFKLLSQWNARGAPYPIDFTVHMTNTQTLPFNTWATATLDLEQRAYTLDPSKYPPETKFTLPGAADRPGKTLTEQERKRLEGTRKQLESAGFQLPWMPDYTRTVTFARQVGAIPLALDFVSGQGRHQANDYSPEMILRDWAMRRIHDIRPGAMYMKNAALARQYEQVLLAFGYGRTGEVAHHNYWEETPYLKAIDHRVKWLALSRAEDRPVTIDNGRYIGLLLLQSYSREDAVPVEVAFPGGAAFLDIQTREVLAGDHARMEMPANFGTRMFLIAQPAAPSVRPK